MQHLGSLFLPQSHLVFMWINSILASLDIQSLFLVVNGPVWWHVLGFHGLQEMLPPFDFQS